MYLCLLNIKIKVIDLAIGLWMQELQAPEKYVFILFIEIKRIPKTAACALRGDVQLCCNGETCRTFPQYSSR